MKNAFVIWEVRLILEIGISDVLFKGRWNPVKLKVDFDKNYQSMNELSMKSVSEDFKKLRPWKGIMNLILEEKLQGNQTTINNLMNRVRELYCEINHMHDSLDSQDAESMHCGQLFTRSQWISDISLTKMSEEDCWATRKLCRLLFWIRSFQRKTFLQVHMYILRRPIHGYPHHGTILIQEEFPREPVRGSLHLKMVMEEKAQYQIRDVWEVRRPEIHSTLWRIESMENYGVDQQRVRIPEPHVDKFTLSTNVFGLENKVQDWSVPLFKFPFGRQVMDQRRRVVHFSGRFKIYRDPFRELPFARK